MFKLSITLLLTTATLALAGCGEASDERTGPEERTGPAEQ